MPDDPYIISDHLRPPDSFFSNDAKKIERNIKNMSVYVDLLTKAKNKASNNDTLGERRFLDTVGTCKLPNGSSTNRYLWVDNEVKDGDGGLLTSMINTLNNVNINISATTPMCKCVKGNTRDNDHNEEWQHRYISNSEFKETAVLKAGAVEDCNQAAGIDEDAGTDGFTNLRSAEFPKDPMHKMYLTSITLLGGYILFLLYTKRN